MLGIGAAKSNQKVNPFIRNSLKPLLGLAKGMIACAAEICQNALVDYQKEFIDELKDANLKILICHNINVFKSEIKGREEHYETELKLTEIVSYRPREPIDNYTIHPLSEKLDSFIKTHKSEIIQFSNQQKDECNEEETGKNCK